MKTTRRLVIVCALLILALTSVVGAQQGIPGPTRDPVAEQTILEQLGRISSEAAPLFQEATMAMDAENWAAAKQGYERVLALAPGFPDALRRLSYAEGTLGNAQAAIGYAQQAYDTDPSPINQSALARALWLAGDESRAAEALKHARAAADALPDDPSIQVVLLLAGSAAQDREAMRQGSSALLRLEPTHPLGHYAIGIVAAEDGQWEKAERELLRAQELGWPAEDIQFMLDQGISSQASIQRWLRRGRNALIAWVVTGGALFGVGMILSRLTLAAVSRARTSQQFGVGRGEGIVRVVYRLVIALSSAYFYVSIPLLILVVLALVAAIFYLFLVLGRIPIRLAVFIAIAAIYTLIAVVRSVFVRFGREEPGKPLLPDEAPELWALVQRVATDLKTRSVDAIYVTPDTDVAVIERGGWWARLRDAGQRCLILGLGALPGMTESEFKAILAHEYGHFSQRDTAGGNLAHRVSASIYAMAIGLARAGQARWYNPAWLFVNAFRRVYMRITLGASRLQEILADRYAATAYGAQNLATGLTRLIRQSLIFDLQVTHEVEVAMTQKTSLPNNLYALPPLEADQHQKQIEDRMAEILSAATSPYDSHPTPRERFALIEHLPQPNAPEESTRPVVDLIPTVERLQQEMTAVIQENVRRAQE